MVNLFTGVFENPEILALKREIAMNNLLESEQIDTHISGTNQFQYAEHLMFGTISTETDNETLDSDLVKVIESHIDVCDSCAIGTFNIAKHLEVFLDEKATIKMVAGYLANAQLEMEARDE